MDKLTGFLARNVQWLALGCGAIYLLYMSYSYLGHYVTESATPPLFVQLDNKQLEPGMADKYIVDNQVVKLEGAMKGDPAVKAITVEMKDGIRTVKVGDLTLTRNTIITAEDGTTPIALDRLKAGALVKVQADTRNSANPDTVVVVSPIPDDLESIFTNKIGEKDVKIGTEFAGLTGPHREFGDYKGPASQPATIPGTAPEPPYVQPPIAALAISQWTVIVDGEPPVRADKCVFSGRFKIDAAFLQEVLNSAFKNVKNCPPLTPVFSRVYLYREEMMPDGKWSKPIIIDPPPTVHLEPYPGNGKDYAKGEKTEVWNKYKAWADKSQALIKSPPFYKAPPDVPPYVVPGAPAATGPNVVVPQARPPVTPAPASPGQPGQPAGNVVAPAAEIEFIVYDTSLVEGKTYRYGVSYRLLNPLFEHEQQVSADLAATFDFKSAHNPTSPGDDGPDSKVWTAPVVVEPTIKIFVTKINGQNSQAQFNVSKWKDGRWTDFPGKPKPGIAPPKPLTPGDPIMADTATGWMLVDVRKEEHQGVPKGEEKYVLVTDGTGKLRKGFEGAGDDLVSPKQ